MNTTPTYTIPPSIAHQINHERSVDEGCRRINRIISPHPVAGDVVVPEDTLFNNNERKRVLIIFTGGTIGMSKEAHDSPLKPKKDFVSDTLATFIEIQHPDVPDFDVIEWETPIDSSDISPDDWVRLAKQIAENYYKYDGFVVLSGTDTMSYTASMLSFLLENLSKTVVLTGSMIPLNEPVSDAKRNLLVSMMVAAHLGVTEVLIFFNTFLLRGNRAKKLDPWRINAIESPCIEPIATMGVGIHVNTKLLLPPPSRKFHCHTQLFSKIICLSMTPAFSYSSLRAIATEWKSDPNGEPPAIILLLFGTGNAPIKHAEFHDTLALCLSENCPVVVLSQCTRGSTSLDTYEGGIFMKNAGVIDGLDMTVEAASTKLAYLMGRGFRGERLKIAMETNLRGELSKKSSITYAGSTLSRNTAAML